MPAELRIVMLGAPGAGKGTQAKRISAAYGVPHVSTGDMFRAEVEAETSLGREVQDILAAGRLVPDELTVRMLKGRIERPDARHGFVLDGFPRSEPQARVLNSLLADVDERLDVAILLAVPDRELVERLSARRSCPVCGAIYNLKSNPPREDEICDNREHDRTKLVTRADDTEEVVRRRLAVYHEATEPVVSYYEEMGVLATVDAAGAGRDDVFDRIERTLTDKGVVSSR